VSLLDGKKRLRGSVLWGGAASGSRGGEFADRHRFDGGGQMMRVFQSIVLGCLAVVVWVGFVQAAEEAAEEKEAVPIIEVEKSTYDFGQVSQGEIVKHDFRMFNRGSASLEIKNVKPG
jgi:hypothetical protein